MVENKMVVDQFWKDYKEAPPIGECIFCSAQVFEGEGIILIDGCLICDHCYKYI